MRQLEEITIEQMPCGSRHSCFDCIAWYNVRGCSFIKRMTDDEYRTLEGQLHARKKQLTIAKTDGNE